MLKINVKKDVLVKTVQDVAYVIDSKPNLPILSGLKISTVSDGIRLVGTDNDMTIVRTIPLQEKDKEIASVKEEGSIVLNAKFLLDIVKKAPKEDISIEVGKNLVTKVQSGKSSFKLNGFDAEDFPKLPQIDGEADFSVAVGELKALIGQTSFAASTSETRPILTGVNITLDKGVKAVATDSHRLALKTMAISTGDEARNITIPAKSLTELSKVLVDQEEMVDVKITDTQILFQSHNLFFYSRLLDGNFPDISRLIPESFKTNLLLNKKELKGALDRCSLLITEKVKVVNLQVTDNKAMLTVTHPEIGTVEEFIEDVKIEGEDIKIAFSTKFALDALNSIGTNKVKIDFVGALRPFLIRADNDDALTQLVLPVRVQ